MSKKIVKWLDKPEDHNYPAAQSYLNLIYDEVTVNIYIDQLKVAPITIFKAKDIFRASGLSLLGISNKHVKRGQEKIKAEEALSPLCLVRDSVRGKVIIADGYHRLCAIYSYHEDALIHCKIV